ncbi:MAG: heme lyase CcmF/NrfE family subunit [Hyphomonadaceae bacterium]
MIAELGFFLSLLALAASGVQAGAGLWAGVTNAQPLAQAARAAAQACTLLIALAFGALIALFVQSDFSAAVVYQNSHTLQPLIYKITGAWGNHEGSMLLWCLVSAGAGAALATLRGGLSFSLWSRAVGVQGLVTAGALAYTILLSNPFARLADAPFEGRSLNPLLQDPALAAHPPLLYAGYVGLSIPFSFAIAALLEGKADQAWARALRPWTLLAWTSLTLGIAMGSYWAYYELGWGGWWFWDPVENASFMPWLAACALVHSAIVTERRGSLASWTILLAIGGFGFALLGTFLVRSGVLTSVHAFAVDPRRGVAVLVLLCVALGGGFGLYAWRAPQLQRPTGFAAVSREGFLVWNNLGLAAAAGVVLIGTLYPLMVEAAGGGLISVGPPYFNLTVAPILALLLAALPVAPLMTWRSGDARAALAALLPAFAVAGLAAAVVLVRGAPWAALGLGVGVWLTLGALFYLRVRLKRGEGRWLTKLAALPLAAWSMSAAHLGAGVLTIGAVAETAFKTETAAMLAPGQSIAFAGRAITLSAIETVEGPNYEATRADFQITRGGATRTASAERRFYPDAGAPTTEVAIVSALDGDLYIALGEPQRDGAAWATRLYHNPMVQLIFGGALLMALGGALSLFDLARRGRR